MSEEFRNFQSMSAMKREGNEGIRNVRELYFFIPYIPPYQHSLFPSLSTTPFHLIDRKGME